MWDLSSLTRDRTHTPCIRNTGSYPLDHTRKSQTSYYYYDIFPEITGMKISEYAYFFYDKW